MKIIFLDVDGVLNSWGTEERAPSGCVFVDTYLVRNLARVLEETDAKVVLSSTWRYEWGNIDQTCSADFLALRDECRINGIEFFDKTPAIGNGADRDAEIKAWLAANSHLEIEKYIAIDDETYLFRNDPSYLIHIDPAVGLNYRFQRIIIDEFNDTNESN